MYSRTPVIRTLVTRIAKYADRLGPSGKFVENSTKLWNYQLWDQVRQSVTASRTSNKAWSKGLDAGILVYCK